MTQALSYALMLAFFRNDMGFGGNNGFTDFKDILGFDLHEDGTRVVGKFKFQHDIDDATATLVGENGLRRWHRLIPIERDGLFASGRLEIPGRFDRPALGML